MFKKDINLRDRIVNLSLKQIGKDYVHNTYGPNSFDCASLVWYIYKEILNIDIFEMGYGLSTTTKIMTGTYGKITLYDEYSFNKDLTLIKKGDILFFHRQSKDEFIPKVDNKYPGHVAIYIGDNNFIHASRTKKKVIKSSLNKPYWKKVLVGSKNIVDNF